MFSYLIYLYAHLESPSHTPVTANRYFEINTDRPTFWAKHARLSAPPFVLKTPAVFVSLAVQGVHLKSRYKPRIASFNESIHATVASLSARDNFLKSAMRKQ